MIIVPTFKRNKKNLVMVCVCITIILLMLLIAKDGIIYGYLKYVSKIEDSDTRENLIWPVSKMGYFFKDSLIKCLKRPDTSIAAAIALRDMNHPPLAMIRDALKSDDIYTKKHALWILGYLKDADSYNSIVSLLDDRNFEIRIDAIIALEEIGNKDAFFEIKKLIRDENPIVRENALRVMVKLRKNDSSVIVFLKEALKDKDPEVREETLNLLYRLEADEAMDLIISSLNDENPSVRARAAEIIAMKPVHRAYNSIVLLLNDNDNDVKLYAILALGAIGDKKAVPILLGLLKKNKDMKEVKSTIYALGRIGDPEAIPYLIDNAEKNKTNSDIVVSVIESLGEIGDKSILRP